MLHKALADYLGRVELAILRCSSAYVERYVEEILTPERVNLRIRIRFAQGLLLELNEAVVVAEGQLIPLDYRYHCQDRQGRLIFRYDSTPHFPGIVTFPHHKHLPDDVVASSKPSIELVVQEAMEAAERAGGADGIVDR